jgi:hypothetical protein
MKSRSLLLALGLLATLRPGLLDLALPQPQPRALPKKQDPEADKRALAVAEERRKAKKARRLKRAPRLRET